MPLVKTKAGPIWFADHRKPDKPGVILVHGAGASHLDWPPQLRRLEDVSILVPDLPGHGKSGGAGLDSVNDYAEAIAAFMDALDIPRAILCGHSMGGAICQTIALTYPERVNGLILIATGSKLPVNDAIINGICENKSETLQLVVNWMWAKSTPDEVRKVSYDRQMEVEATIIRGDYIACNTFDVRDQLSQIAAPTLVMGGTHDKMTPLKFSETLANTIPNAEQVVIENGGHMMMMEQPEAVSGAIENWLLRLRDAGQS